MATTKVKRIHCKLHLKELVLTGLSAEPEVSGLAWVEYPRVFAVNFEQFAKYYRELGRGSTTKIASLKNRFTQSKSGFVSLVTVPPPGYDKNYTHTNWHTSEHVAALSAARQCSALAPMGTAGLRAADEVKSPPLAESLPPTERAAISACAEPPGPAGPPAAQPGEGAASALDLFLGPDWLPIQLLERQPANVWQTLQFDAALFLDAMCATPGLHMNDIDKNNFELLLRAEGPPQTAAMLVPTYSLKAFGERYGPWPRIVANIREFVRDGAREWFYGKCDDGAAAARALEQHGAGYQHYFVRAVSVEYLADLRYVFAITYRAADGAIVHERIYRDDTGQLCMVNDAREVEFFSGFKHLVRALMRDPIPAAAGQFGRLMPQLVKRTTIEDGPEFKRHRRDRG